MKIIVTGANGYIGSHVVQALLANKEYEVTAVDIDNSNIDANAKFINIDILKNAAASDLYQTLGLPEAVIHMAWRDGFNHASLNHIQDLFSHYGFLKNMIDSGCKNISVMGSMHEVGYHEGVVDENTPCNPLSLYGVAKNALRQMIFICPPPLHKDISLKWFRGFYVCGDDWRNKSVFSKILQMEKEGKTSFPFTDGKNKYDFIDIKTLALYIAKASVQKTIDGIINVCSGKAVSLKDKVEEFLFVNKLKIRPEFGVFPGRKYDSPIIYGDNSKILKIMETI
ncbi:NAD-dependent epimerase/dehydratase family protein [Endomicrobium proavitum]|uniref:Nucleoside-diphosphate-sugar epimerases-like protein n=1 Tax=Endomicrobium proavitum TaxID=1408281 RepID=A0A0G3WIZ3_9BACT|nr:NAD(P)-dependent oxidoreductase [Endomicrobium proavitum]AKL98626.1 nucleoside-diphosphate-sugar epimerases-like protein [Endomicrobium proavitum]